MLNDLDTGADFSILNEVPTINLKLFFFKLFSEKFVLKSYSTFL